MVSDAISNGKVPKLGKLISLGTPFIAYRKTLFSILLVLSISPAILGTFIYYGIVQNDLEGVEYTINFMTWLGGSTLVGLILAPLEVVPLIRTGLRLS